MRKTLTTEEFIERAKKIHGDTYDYSKVNYKNTKTKVTIICPIHGEFEQTPDKHLLGHGCYMCSKNRKKDTNEFIKRAREIHGDKYDYSKVNYTNNVTPVIIICPKHGEFYQTPHTHLAKKGCPMCAKKLMRNAVVMKYEEFIERAKKVHGDKYDYSKTNLDKRDCYGRVRITCPIHGEFFQPPYIHLLGFGCKKCKNSRAEAEIIKMLDTNKVNYDYQCGCKKLKWMGTQTLDFYIPEINVAIECQGKQHFKPVDFAGQGRDWAINELEKNIKRDALKRQKCKDNGVELIYYVDEKYKEYINEKENKAFFNKEKLLEYINGKNIKN